MRFSTFLVSLAFLGSISAQALISGTWIKPEVSKNVSSFCCIPTSLEIHSLGNNGYMATYRYPSYPTSSNQGCLNLFVGSSNSDLKLYKGGNTSITESAYSETTFVGNMNFKFEASNATGSPKLHIYSEAGSPFEACDFIMDSKFVPGSSGLSGFGMLIIIFLLIMFADASKKMQRRRTRNIIYLPEIPKQRKSNQPTAPVLQVHQGYAQPQQNYIAPNPFLNPQVPRRHTYIPPNQFQNPPMNMNYGGNAQFPVPQINLQLQQQPIYLAPANQYLKNPQGYDGGPF